VRAAPRWLVWLLASLVFAAAFGVFFERADRVGYNTDEGQWIWTTRYFQLAFLDRQLTGPAWDETYWTLTQPMVPRYIMGATIWLSGRPLPELDLEHRIDEARGPDRARYLDPSTFRDERRLAEQRRVPRPSPEVLWAARLPMVVVGAGTVALLFAIAAELAGVVAGLVTAASFVAAPFALTLIPRAHSEAPTLFFLVLALWLAIQATRAAARAPDREDAPRDGFVSRRSLCLGAACGLAAGLSAGSKLSGLLALAALGGFAVWAFGLALLARRPGLAASVGPVGLLERTWRWNALGALVGLLVFVAVDPFLWPDPVGRLQAMLAFRQQEMFGQQQLSQELAIPDGLATRLPMLIGRSAFGEPWAARRLGVPVEALLAAAGVVVAAARSIRGRGHGGAVGPDAVVGIWTLAMVVGTAANLGIDWDRYYLPIVALGLVFAGVGAAALVEAARRVVSRRRAPTTTAAAPPPIPTASSGSAG
jgi:hypothetical protein